MTRSALRTAIVSAFVVGGFLVIFFTPGNHNHNVDSFRFVNPLHTGVTCTGCGMMPEPTLVTKVAVAKGTSGTDIALKELSSSQAPKRSSVDPRQFRGEVTTRAIPAGAVLTAADFALRGPIYYERGFPTWVSASQIPAKMSRWIGPAGSRGDLELAPGVWVDGSTADAAIDEHVANGTLVGYCRSVRAFRAHNPKVPFATKCWQR